MNRRRIRLTYVGTSETVIAEMLDDEAPAICEHVWNMLPIEKQVRRHLHVMVYGEYVQETQVALARRLASVLPSPLSSIYFTSSGAEAIEGSLKLARKSTGRVWRA